MNKARLTYRFDRTGLKEDGTGTSAPKEPWNRDGKPAEAQAAEPAPGEMRDNESFSSAGWEPLGETVSRAEQKRREREAALRSARRESWEWSDADVRDRESGRKPERHDERYEERHDERYEERYDYGLRVDKGSGYGNRGTGKVIPLHEDERRAWESERDWSRRYDQADEPFRGASVQDETIRIENLIRQSESRSRPDGDRYPYEEWNDDRRIRPEGSLHSASSSRSGSAWDSPRSAEASRYETDLPYRSYDYSDSRGPEIEDSLLYPEARSVRRRNLGWLKVAASLAGALVVGGMLGYYVLTLFNSTPPADSNAPAADGSSAIVQTDTDTTGSGAGTGGTLGGEESAAAAAEANIALPEQSFVLLQNGKFSTPESAAAAAGALDDSGYAAVTEPGDFYFVYAGIAADRESARILEEKLKAGKFEVYAKEYTLPAVSHVEWTGDTVPLQAYLEETNRLTRTMSGLTLVHLEEDSVTPLDAESLSSIKKTHQTWTQKAAAIKGVAPADAKALLQKMDNGINTAEKSLEAYGKNPSTSLLNQAQTNLIQCLLAEKQLLATIGSK